jgi:uncharacterized protein YecA (UPF0149 family)
MKVLDEIYKVTLEIKRLAEVKDLQEDSISNIVAQLDLRQKLIDELPETFTNEEKKLGKEITVLNTEIDQLMNANKRNLVDKMKQFRHQKKSLNRYRGHDNALLNRSGAYLDIHE